MLFVPGYHNILDQCYSKILKISNWLMMVTRVTDLTQNSLSQFRVKKNRKTDWCAIMRWLTPWHLSLLSRMRSNWSAGKQCIDLTVSSSGKSIAWTWITLWCFYNFVRLNFWFFVKLRLNGIPNPQFIRRHARTMVNELVEPHHTTICASHTVILSYGFVWLMCFGHLIIEKTCIDR